MMWETTCVPGEARGANRKSKYTLMHEYVEIVRKRHEELKRFKVMPAWRIIMSQLVSGNLGSHVARPDQKVFSGSGWHVLRHCGGEHEGKIVGI